MKRKFIRREFLRRGCLAVLGAELAACAGPQRLADITPVEPTDEAMPSSTPLSLPTDGRVRLVEGLPLSITKDEPVPDGLHEARYYVQLESELVQCGMCFRRCVVPERGRGFCRKKVNLNGHYYTLVYGRPSALQIAPIEKEPSFHFWPGAIIFCTGTASCNNRCKFRQNWHLSQRSFEEIDHEVISPANTVAMAQEWGCHAVSFTYNEPTVFYEHMFDVAKLDRRAGTGTLLHSNGSMNEEPLAALLEYMDAVTIDLKAFIPEFYPEVSSSELQPVLRTLGQIHETGLHLEIVNLMVTTFNDDMDDVRRMCQCIRDTLSDEVPLHFTRFFPAYKLTSLPSTPVDTLESAAQVADEEGLQYVYIGNVPGHERNSTFCPACGAKIIDRKHFSVRSLDVVRGECVFCDHHIPSVWRNA